MDFSRINNKPLRERLAGVHFGYKEETTDLEREGEDVREERESIVDVLKKYPHGLSTVDLSSWLERERQRENPISKLHGAVCTKHMSQNQSNNICRIYLSGNQRANYEDIVSGYSLRI